MDYLAAPITTMTFYSNDLLTVWAVEHVRYRKAPAFGGGLGQHAFSSFWFSGVAQQLFRLLDRQSYVAF